MLNAPVSAATMRGPLPHSAAVPAPVAPSHALLISEAEWLALFPPVDDCPDHVHHQGAAKLRVQTVLGKGGLS